MHQKMRTAGREEWRWGRDILPRVLVWQDYIVEEDNEMSPDMKLGPAAEPG